MNCTKVPYDTHDEANAAIARVSKKFDGRRKPLRVYRCQHCGRLHLTSTTRKDLHDRQHRRERQDRTADRPNHYPRKHRQPK